MVSPRPLAVLRLITSSNFVGCWNGSSAGLAPLRAPRWVYDRQSIHLRRLLRLGGQRRGEEASSYGADEESPIHHSITWSARCSSEGGILSPMALAVLRLITSSNVVGCSTGRSAGFAPLRILSMKSVARRESATTFGP